MTGRKWSQIVAWNIDRVNSCGTVEDLQYVLTTFAQVTRLKKTDRDAAAVVHAARERLKVIKSALLVDLEGKAIV